MMRRRDPARTARRGATPARLSRVAALLLLLLAAAHARGQAPSAGARPPDPSQLFREARAVGDRNYPDAFEFELSGYDYRIAKNGAGRRVKGDQTRLFNLRLVELDEIRRVEFMEYEGNVLLLCAVDYGDGGGGFVYRLEQPSMRSRWGRDVPALNVRAVREGAALYLAGYGFIGKLDLRTGTYLWQRGELVEKKQSRIPPSDFEQPDVSGDVVLLREKPSGAAAPARTFRLHKQSGKILGID